MDQNNPARFLDTAYNALKANPNATGQILQAAAQGQPVGLRGLAAAAAQQNQQEAQKAAMAQNVRGPQPSVIQQLAGASGIMGQLPSNLQLASAPTGPAPEEMPPQMMAGGGLVAFAGGGNVLPPDVIDAIQSHFAEGGDVRGFAGGEEIMALLRGAADELPYGELGSFIEGPGATPRPMPADYGPMGSFIEGAPREAPSKLDMLKRLFASRKSPFMTDAQKDVLAKQLNWNMIEGGGEAFPSVPESVSRLAGKAKPAAEFLMGKVATPLAILSDPVLQAATKANVGLAKAVAGGKDAFAETPVERAAYHLPELAGKGMDYLLDKAAPAGEVNEAISKSDWEARRTRPVPVTDKGSATPTWKADSDPHTGTPATPKAIVHTEGQKLDKTFDQAKVDTGTKTTDQAAQQGLDSLDQGREIVDYIKSLYGEKKMSPEISQKLADLQDKARTSTILQSVLGGLAGGLSNPYGGRFALGSAALNALGGYQKGIGSEEDIQRKVLDIERAYADQPAEMQTAAAKEYLDLTKEKMRGLSAERVAEGRSESALERALISGGFAQRRAETMAGAYNPYKEAQMRATATSAAETAVKNLQTAKLQHGEVLTPEEAEQKYNEVFNQIMQGSISVGGLGAGQAQQQQYGLGARPTGRSIIGGKLTGSSPQ